MKKLTALFLALVLCLSLCTVAFADGTNDIKNGTPQSAKETNHGYITIDKETAAENATVTVTVNANEGYQLKSLTVAPTGFVDLGITDTDGTPLYWAERNLGASNPQDPGNYYMWGATALMYSAVDRSKTNDAFTFVTVNPYGDNYKNTWQANLGFTWNNLPLTKGVFDSTNNIKKVFTKYTTSDEYAESGTPDNFVTLKPEDDAATAENENWRIPTKDEFVALATNCVWVWTSDYSSTGNAGYIVYKAKNDADKGKTNMNGTWKKWNDTSYASDSEATGTYSTSDAHIFLPAAGYGNNTNLLNFNKNCSYWESSLDSTYNHKAYSLNLSASTGSPQGSNDRRNAFSIRPVMNFSEITPAKQTDGTYQFTMPGYAVTVTAEFEEKAITIADILPDDFPTFSWPLPDNVWKNSVGSKMYINNNGLTFGGVNINNILSKPVTKDGNNYKYISNQYTITFVMDSDKLVKVITDGSEYADNNGDYIPTYTVSFSMNGHGTAPEAITNVASGTTINKPTDPTATGYTFGGWYKEAGCTQAWNFGTDEVTANTTLYAKWIADAVQKAAIRGNVKEDGSNVIGATVELFLGTEKVAATVTKGNPAGDYNFDNVENGVYNIVVTKDGKTKTELVTVDTANTFAKDVKLPTSDVSSQVEHKGNEVSGAKSDISQTVVGGLDVAAAANAEVSKKVVVKLTVEPKADTNTPAQTSIKNLPEASGKKVEFLDLSLTKTVDGAEIPNFGDTNTQLLTIVIPFDFSGVDVRSVMILRNHGGNTEKLTGTANANGEYFKADEQAGTLTIFAKKFSDYAVAYKEQSTGGHGGGSYTPGHTVTSDLKSVTKVTIDGKVVDSRYYTVSGGNVTLTDAFMKTLANGKHTVKLYNGDVVATGTMTVSGNAAVVSAKTADAGIALYGVLSVSSLLGMGWVRKKEKM